MLIVTRAGRRVCSAAMTVTGYPAAPSLPGMTFRHLVMPDDLAGRYINPEENERFGRERGWVENISVRRPWRRRGLARALIAASIAALRVRGMTEGALGVDTENPSGALRLYESCGFAAVKREAAYRKPLDAP